MRRIAIPVYWHRGFKSQKYRMAEGLLTFGMLHESPGKDKKPKWLTVAPAAENQLHPDAAALLAWIPTLVF
jgi:hypothetical protein